VAVQLKVATGHFHTAGRYLSMLALAPSLWNAEQLRPDFI
jgi:hypothetical protein